MQTEIRLVARRLAKAMAYLRVTKRDYWQAQAHAYSIALYDMDAISGHDVLKIARTAKRLKG